MEKVAVIGMANLFPGSKQPAEFWENLLAKKDSRTQATEEQMGEDPQAFAGKKGETDKYYCMRGGYIHDFELDCNGFRLPADYIRGLDDVFQWPLYVAREALIDAGQLDRAGVLARCGVILGNLSFPTKQSNHLFLPLYHHTVEGALGTLLGHSDFHLENYTAPRAVHPANALVAGYPSALVAQALGLGGSHFSLDAACASSCYSVKLACDYLHTGKSDLMLAGAVSASDPFFVNMGFSIFQAYPSDNKSAPLDKSSGGLFAGEGAGMLVLKRYSDALRDGDHINAVIKGGALSNDGKGEFVLSPNTKGQVLAYERAYEDAGISPADIDFVECHATGTPKGDKVELGSMETYFGKHNSQPLIGSVKSNLAHLLTAAGMPGMMKTIMAMNAGKIPPTINLQTSVHSPNNYIGQAQIPTDIVPWPENSSGRPRRAGVSVFGFGGSNAHLVLEQFTGEQDDSMPIDRSQPLAIVGMDTHFGDCEGLDNFAEGILQGKQYFTSLPPRRWKGMDRETEMLKQLGIASGQPPMGAYVPSFDIDFLRFKIPPNENDCLIPQQLMMIEVADNAAIEARLEIGSNVAVLVAMGMELELHQFRGRVNLDVQVRKTLHNAGIVLSPEQEAQLANIAKGSVHDPAQLNQYTSFIGNIMASRISSLWDFSGPAITVSAEENSVYRCIELADNLFQTSDVEAVIIAAVDLAGSAESVLLRNQFARINTGDASLGFDQQSNGWMVGEGAGAVVLKRMEDAVRGNRIYATIDALSFSTGTHAAAIAAAARDSLAKAGKSAADIGYLEAYASGVSAEDQAESDGLAAIYPDTPAGSVKANIGHTFAASGLASLIKAAVCLYHGVKPPTPQWGGAKPDCALNINVQRQDWQGTRSAAISGIGFDGCSAHLVLSAAPEHRDIRIPDSYAKPKAQLIRSITLGGEAIQDSILSEQNLALFASVRNDIAGQVLPAARQPVALPLSADPRTIPQPAYEHEDVTMNNNKLTLDALSEEQFNELLENSPHLVQFNENLSLVSTSHSAFLETRNESMQTIARLIRLQTQAVLGGAGSAQAEPAATLLKRARRPKLPIKYNQPEKVIWNTADLVEFAEGKIANVFGPEFSIIDSYPRRVRLPTTDYLLVTRVTELDAEVNNYRPSMMTTEYDIPVDAPYLIDGQIPWSVSVESGQCDLLLISYLGIDFQNKGIRVYRLLDCTLTFLEDMAFGGETLRYEIHIDSFARNGETLLFFFHYDCFVGDKKVLIMRGGCAGFFTDQELEEGKGVIETDADRAQRANAVKSSFTPLIANDQTAYEYEDMLKLVHGDIRGCFGPGYEQHDRNLSLKFSSEKFLMIERVSKIDRSGGAWGLGMLTGHKQLEPDHWYFPCHFKDDQVMAGSLMAEGCGQLVMFFMMYLGMYKNMKNARFQPMAGEPQKVRCRGQVLPQSAVLTYQMEVTEIGMSPSPYMKANVDIILDGRIVVDFKNIGVTMKEFTGELEFEDDPGQPAVPHTPSAPVREETSRVKPVVEKDPFANVHAPLMKVVADTSRPLIKGVTPIRHIPAPEIPGGNRTPDTVPFEPYHMFEFATGRIADCFGPEFSIYDNITPPRTPCGDLQLTTRVTEVRGTRHDLKSKAYCRGEYEVPADAWYFEKNTYPSMMPYSILMEISLQPNGFVSAWVGTTLRFPDKELFFRNLDGRGTLLRKVDLRGKTIINDSNLLSTTIAGANIIQSFDFTLSTDGEPFYKGEAVFGYFLAGALKDQLGLDNGRITHPWHVDNNRQAERIDLRDPEMTFFKASPGKPHYRLAGGQLHFVDTIDVVEGGGKEGKGYIYAEREIDPTDWFFRYHFHEDPVMPGSLGVEAIIEIMQAYMLKNDLGAQFKNPRFNQILSEIIWKYRGQINPLNRQMSLDVHITNLIREPDRVTLIGDANLSKDGLRIYEVKDIAICLEEAE